MVSLLSMGTLSNIFVLFFFFNDTATTEIYTLSLHDALPISSSRRPHNSFHRVTGTASVTIFSSHFIRETRDRKSTRLNSSHLVISYAVFCLKKKKKTDQSGPAKSRTTPYQSATQGHKSHPAP